MTQIAIVDGHPDPDRGRYVHALADAYAEGAAAAGHEVRRIDVAALDFPFVRSQADWERGAVPADIATAQAAIAWAEHLVFLYPLWLGDVPALLKAFLEQIARPEFAFRYRAGGLPEKLLAGRSARVIVTMGMPGLFYRLVYRAHSLKSFERNILHFVGIKPVRKTVIGAVGGSAGKRAQWLEAVRESGRRGA